jgi:hypothetical protein
LSPLLRFNNGPEDQISLPHLRLEGMGITGCKSDMRQLPQGYTPERHQGLEARELSVTDFSADLSCAETSPAKRTMNSARSVSQRLSFGTAYTLHTFPAPLDTAKRLLAKGGLLENCIAPIA